MKPNWLSVILALSLAAPIAWADWPTYRGNAQRTGNVDNKPGPAAPKVLWVHKSDEHFLAAPAIGDGHLLITALGAFNTGTLHALSLDPAAEKRIAWSKGHLPAIASSPSFANGLVVFGDGMHQTDDGTLHLVEAATGRPVSRRGVRGRLIHLEGAPTLAGGKAYIGGGAAGIICIDLERVSLDGKEQPAAKVREAIAQKWRELQEKHEADKKADPDFAIPPSEMDLPQAEPVLLWQAGKEKWHVDAAVAVVGDRLLAASAFLDAEKVGNRALLCLDAATGQVKWEVPLEVNPWGGPTVLGDVVLIGCSNVRFDPKEAAAGKGQVVAVSLADGTVLWKKPVPGGVLSPIAAVGNLAIFTATDGSTRAWDIRSGDEKWAVNSAAPFFAAPAVAGDRVYVADLKGQIQAISLDGKPLWKLDLAADPAVKAPGMVFSSPVVHHGRLYVATCNLEAEEQRMTVVVCVGEK